MSHQICILWYCRKLKINNKYHRKALEDRIWEKEEFEFLNYPSPSLRILLSILIQLCNPKLKSMSFVGILLKLDLPSMNCCPALFPYFFKLYLFVCSYKLKDGVYKFYPPLILLDELDVLFWFNLED